MYDDDKIVAEKDNAGVISTKYIYDAEGALLYIEQGANKYYPIDDGLGSIVMLRDQNGATVATFEYDDWGKLTNKTGTVNSNLQFASYFWDNDAQLYHLGARWYDPTLARFVSADPHPGDSDDSMSQNEYLYCRNNPVNYTDPDGDYVETALDIASVAYSANEFKKNR
jgi:RHS repeat-associated protein